MYMQLIIFHRMNACLFRDMMPSIMGLNHAPSPSVKTDMSICPYSLPTFVAHIAAFLPRPDKFKIIRENIETEGMNNK